MYLLEWIEGDKIQYIGIFESVESGRTFMQKVPGYRYEMVKEDGFSFDEEMIEYDKLPDIIMIEHNGYQVPVSRFSFEADIMVIWIELDYLDMAKNSNTDLNTSLSGALSVSSDASDISSISLNTSPFVIASGATRVDAYSINNEDVKAYITKREENYRKCVVLFDKRGYEIFRAGFGSEDGEYILVRKKTKSSKKSETSEKIESVEDSEKSNEDWRFFAHMDPSFLEMDIAVEIRKFLEEMEE